MNHLAFLTKRLKQLLHQELLQHFSSDPVFNNKLVVVNNKSDMEKFPYGIIFKNINGNKYQLGLDDYIGLITSYVSSATVGNYPSKFLGLVTEDTNNLFYIAEEDLSSLCDGSTLKFPLAHIPYMQDPFTGDLTPCLMPENINVMINGTKTLAAKVDPIEKTFYLFSSPLPNSTLKVNYAFRNIVNQGYYFLEMTSVAPDKTAEVYVGAYESIERQPVIFKSISVKIYIKQSLFINNKIKVFVDGLEITSGFTINSSTGILEFTYRPKGNLLQLKDKNNNVLQTYADWRILKYAKTVLIDKALGNELTSYLPSSNIFKYTLYSNGKKLVPRTSSTPRGTFDYAVKNGIIRFVKPLKKGSDLTIDYIYFDTDVEDYASISTLFDSATEYKLPSSLNLMPDFFEVYENTTLLSSEDYEVDFSTNTILLYRLPRFSASYYISYRLDNGTKGPYTVTPNTIRNDILPGCLLHFNNNFQPNDKVVILVGDQRKACADEYGGKWQFSVELATICPDPISSEDLTDKLGIFIAALLKPKFDALGMFISPEVQIGGDSNEERDDATNDVDFQNTISFSVMTDWYVRVPRKFRLMSFANQIQLISISPQTESLDDYEYYPKFVDGKNYMLYSTERI